MDFSKLSLVDTAFAQAGAAAQQPSIVDMLIMPVGFLIILYFFMIRPQAKKARDHQELITGLKTGDEIVTTGGIIGRVKTVSDTFVTIEAGNSNFKIVKEHVTALTKQPARPPAKNSKAATSNS